MRGFCVWLLGLLALLAGPAAAGEFGSDYVANGKCGPFARAVVTTPPWACLGIVAGPADGLVMPRSVLEVAPGRLLVTDMGGWAKNEGRLLEIRVGSDGSRIVSVLKAGLDRPHGLGLGPDGKVYVGEATAIWRFDPKRTPMIAEKVVDHLPGEGRHPLKAFAFTPVGNLVINVGAPTDRCESSPNSLAAVQYPCIAAEGESPLASLWLLEFDKMGGVKKALTPIARGLRNSMALAVNGDSGLIVQGENNIDLKPENSPPEELNVITRGGNYGWPYCAADTVTPGYGRWLKTCATFIRPTVLLPAHAAPLGMLYYHGAMFPRLAGKLVVALHGYRANGHRIVAYDRTADGIPIAPPGGQPAFPLLLVDGWDDRPGVRPRGAPTGISAGLKGELWFAEDKNRTIMVLMGGQAATNSAGATRSLASVQAPPGGWPPLAAKLTPVCGQCHEDFRAGSPLDIWRRLAERGWVDPAASAQSKIVKALHGEAPLKPMPPPGGVAQIGGGPAALEAFLRGL
jgi:glucose/arabinose dehydrogenase